MTSTEVRSTIVEAFSEFKSVESAHFLRCGTDNIMVLNEEQDLDGDLAIDLAGQGSFYLTQKRVDVSFCVIKKAKCIFCC